MVLVLQMRVCGGFIPSVGPTPLEQHLVRSNQAAVVVSRNGKMLKLQDINGTQQLSQFDQDRFDPWRGQPVHRQESNFQAKSRRY